MATVKRQELTQVSFKGLDCKDGNLFDEFGGQVSLEDYLREYFDNSSCDITIKRVIEKE